MSTLKKILPKFLFKNKFDKDSNSTNTNHKNSNSANINHKDSNSVITNHDCFGSYWCKECVPSCLIEWSSGNSEIDEFIKNTIYDAKGNYYPLFLEWVPFDRFEDIKPIGEGGFAKVYSAKWIDGRAEYTKKNNGTWKKLDPKPINVVLKRLNGSQNMSSEYLNEDRKSVV